MKLKIVEPKTQFRFKFIVQLIKLVMPSLDGHVMFEVDEDGEWSDS